MAASRRGFGRTRKLPSGRWQAFYGDPDGRTTTSRNGIATPVRHTADATFDTKMDAEAWLVDERRLISAGTWTPPTTRKAARRSHKLTLDEYAGAWLAQRKVKGRPLAGRTREHYADLLARFILPTFGHVALADITDDQVESWYELVAIDRPTTRAHAYSLLRTILTTAVERGLISTANPARIRGAGGTTRARNVKTATMHELAQVVAAMPENRRLMVTLAAWCALRFGELAELRRGDIDTKRGIVKVRRAVVRVRDDNGRMTTAVKPPKSDAGIRDVTIPPHILGDVREHLLKHTAAGRDGLLFPSQHGGHLSPSAFYGRAATFDKSGRRLRPGHGYFEARRQAGRDDLRFHDLRHTGLTNAAQVGATLAELMQLAGHSTASAALKYQHVAHGRMDELAAKLSTLAEVSK